MRNVMAFSLSVVFMVAGLSAPAWADGGRRAHPKRWFAPSRQEQGTNVLGMTKIFGRSVLNDDVVDTGNRYPLVEVGLGAPIATLPFGSGTLKPFNSATLGLTFNWWRGFYNDDVTDTRMDLDDRDPSKDHRIAALSPSLSYIMVLDRDGKPQHGVSAALNLFRWDAISVGFGLAYHTSNGTFGLTNDNLTWIIPVSLNFGMPGT